MAPATSPRPQRAPRTPARGGAALAVGDFNGDGHLDLAVAGFSNDVTILLGAGTGDFTEAPTSPEGAGEGSPASIVAGDFNGDGDLDLAVANDFSDDVTILLGDGTGDFTEAPGSPEAVGGDRDPQAIAAGDFNGDGDLDLAVANWFSGDVTILLGDGTGDFTEAPTSPETSGEGSASVAVGDFNGDDHVDLVVANRFSHDVTILLGDGTGDFTEAPTSPEDSGDDPSDVAVGDFNRDGHLDLAVANSLSNDVTILLGDGTGDFTQAPGSPEPAGDSPVAVAVGDFDGDGDLDLAVANALRGGFFGNTVTILLNQPRDAEPPPSTEQPGHADPAPLDGVAGGEHPTAIAGARPTAGVRPAVLHRTESALRVAASADQARTADAGAEAVTLASTGLPLPSATCSRGFASPRRRGGPSSCGGRWEEIVLAAESSRPGAGVWRGPQEVKNTSSTGGRTLCRPRAARAARPKPRP